MGDAEETVEAELDALITAHYYAEDYELRWALSHWYEALPRAAQAAFHQIALRRLSDDPSIMSVMLCSAARIPEAGPVLAALLDQQPSTNMISRAILATLGDYGMPSAIPAVERFLDSEQEIEALTCLARLHFPGALVAVLRAGRRPHLRDTCLQILHARRKDVGLDGLIEDLKACVDAHRWFTKRGVRKILQWKDEPYQVFTPEEIDRIMDGL